MKSVFFSLFFFSFFICVAQTVPGTDIYLCHLNTKKNILSISHPWNISAQKGYDNQPCFDIKNSSIYYASEGVNSKTDIKIFNYKTKLTENLTKSKKAEYSPTLTPDKKYISCIYSPDSTKQFLVKYPLVIRDTPHVLINDLLIGYHTWIDDNRLLLFVLGEENTLHYYDLLTKKDSIISSNIGRSLHKIPNQNACSFVKKNSEEDLVLMRFDLATMQVSPICRLFRNHEDVAWAPDGRLFCNNGTNIFLWKPKDNSWQMVEQSFGNNKIKGLTRMVISPSNNRIALVIAE